MLENLLCTNLPPSVASLRRKKINSITSHAFVTPSVIHSKAASKIFAHCKKSREFKKALKLPLSVTTKILYNTVSKMSLFQFEKCVKSCHSAKIGKNSAI